MTDFNFCPDCGKKIGSVNWNYCASCGTSVVTGFTHLAYGSIITQPLTWPPKNTIDLGVMDSSYSS